LKTTRGTRRAGAFCAAQHGRGALPSIRCVPLRTCTVQDRRAGWLRFVAGSRALAPGKAAARLVSIRCVPLRTCTVQDRRAGWLRFVAGLRACTGQSGRAAGFDSLRSAAHLHRARRPRGTGFVSSRGLWIAPVSGRGKPGAPEAIREARPGPVCNRCLGILRGAKRPSGSGAVSRMARDRETRRPGAREYQVGARRPFLIIVRERGTVPAFGTGGLPAAS
jgi:hypothetical protein